ncbi:MAG TPA: type II CAAX endopeptidase family protein, partial [Flavobacterium sp.]|nr:type II CAAX endopeptidase family protein [Flavobacterium sp.]
MFIEQAYKGKNDWWRTLITTFLATGIFLLNFIFVFFTSEEDMKRLYASLRGIPNNIALAVNLAPFAFLLGLLFLLVFILHQRNILSLTTARSKLDFGRIFFSFAIIIVMTVIGFAVSYYNDSSEIVWNFQPLNFAILVIISLILFPLQIGFEEYLFRGYLMQQVGIIVKNRWLPLILTSVIFGLFHTANPEVLEMGYGVMVFYIGTGLLLGIMTLMDDSIELALGFHLGNNLMAALLVTSDFSALQTDALFKYSGVEDTAAMLNEMLITMAITYPLILLIFALKYKWTNWAAKLFGKVQSQQ